MDNLAKVTNIYYIVKSGDTLSKIATKFSTSIDQLLKWNPKITNKDLILVGQEIKIGEKNIVPIIKQTEKPIEVNPIEKPIEVNPIEKPIEINKDSKNQTIIVITIGLIALYFLNKG